LPDALHDALRLCRWCIHPVLPPGGLLVESSMIAALLDAPSASQSDNTTSIATSLRRMKGGVHGSL